MSKVIIIRDTELSLKLKRKIVLSEITKKVVII